MNNMEIIIGYTYIMPNTNMISLSEPRGPYLLSVTNNTNQAVLVLPVGMIPSNTTISPLDALRKGRGKLTFEYSAASKPPSQGEVKISLTKLKDK